MPRKPNHGENLGAPVPTKSPKETYLQRFESTTPGFMERWEDLTPEAAESLLVLVDFGIGLFLGTTSDGGRLCLTLCEGEKRRKWYHTSEDMSERLVKLRNFIDTRPRNT